MFRALGKVTDSSSDALFVMLRCVNQVVIAVGNFKHARFCRFFFCDGLVRAGPDGLDLSRC